MITFKPIIIQGGRRRDGTYPVKIRVTFKGVVRRLPTTLVCSDSDITRSGHIKNGDILARAGELIERMRQSCADLSPFTLEAWGVDDVVAHIRESLTREDFHLDFFAFADDFILTKQPTTRMAYTTTLNALARFVGERRLDINAITRGMLLDFCSFVDAEGWMHWTREGLVDSHLPKKVKGGAARAHLLRLSHIFNAAKLRYNDEDTGRVLIPRSPFEGLKKGYPAGQGAKPLPVEVVQALIDTEPRDERERIARAAFLLSLCTMGANMADLWWAKPVAGREWRYNRRKTARRRADGAEARVRLSEPAMRLIRELRGQSEGVWWLLDLHRWQRDTIATMQINRILGRWATDRGFESFTFGAARKTWATLARRLGIEKATVDEGLVHIGDYRVTGIYAERNWSLAWEANDRVLALFRWV